jgi:hypothetical protein
MTRSFIAALALAASSSLSAQTVTSSVPDYTTAVAVGGNWTYAATADGSQATFIGATNQPQVTLHCTRATRRVSIAKPATAAAPFLTIWTSSDTRSAPASFNPATNRLTADFAAFDRLLDAIAFSRGRIAFAVGSGPALVVPPWSEISRVIEDCRV